MVDGGQNRVQKFDSNGRFLLQWGKESFSPGQTFDPTTITIDNHDFVYLMDKSYGTIQIFDRNGKFIVKWALKCGDDQPIQPLDLATDLNGNVYVTDFYSSRICKYRSQRAISSMRGARRARQTTRLRLAGRDCRRCAE